jgi:hypothetical protein
VRATLVRLLCVCALATIDILSWFKSSDAAVVLVVDVLFDTLGDAVRALLAVELEAAPSLPPLFVALGCRGLTGFLTRGVTTLAGFLSFLARHTNNNNAIISINMSINANTLPTLPDLTGDGGCSSGTCSAAASGCASGMYDGATFECNRRRLRLLHTHTHIRRSGVTNDELPSIAQRDDVELQFHTASKAYRFLGSMGELSPSGSARCVVYNK